MVIFGNISLCFAYILWSLFKELAQGDTRTCVRTIDFTVSDLDIPSFGEEWILVGGAYRLARFQREGNVML